MDGRKSALLLLALALASSGCVTTTEKNVTIRTGDEPAPTPAAPVKESAKQPPPPAMLKAFAELKEKDADAVTGNPELQAKLRNEARLAYQELLKTDPDNVAAARGLARVYTRLNDHDRAADIFKKALAKHPKDVTLWYDLGMLHNCRKEWAPALERFRAALEIDPENQTNLKALGFTLARTGQLDQSLVYLTRAMGSPAAAHYNVAQMLLHLAELEPATRAARQELACDHLRRALHANPSYERARERLASLEMPAASQGTVEIQFLEPAH